MLYPHVCACCSVYIDGYSVGTFVLDRDEILDLERPESVAKKFTFYKVSLPSCCDSGVKFDRNILGFANLGTRS